MTLRSSVLLFAGVMAVSLPFGLSACGEKPGTTGDPQEAKKNEKKEAPGDPAIKKPEKQEEKPGDFRLPDDPGGRLVTRVLAPTVRPADLKDTRAKSRPAPRAIENPLPPLPPQVASVPRLQDTSPLRPARPELVTPEPLFGLEEIIGALPQVLTFPEQERVRLVSPDMTQPVPLPRQAQPLLDKVAVTDPTGDASRTAVLSSPLPERSNPASFQRFTLPDPFEHHDAVKLVVPPGDESLSDGSVQLPRK